MWSQVRARRARQAPPPQHRRPPVGAAAHRAFSARVRGGLLVGALLATLGLTSAIGAPDAARAAESPDGLVHIALVPGASEARYIMQVRTLGQPPKAAACTTGDVAGQLVLTPDGAVVPELSVLQVNQRSLRCAAPLRDDMAQQLLQTAQYPLATFVARAAPGLPVPLAAGPQAYQMVGDQSVRGVTRSVAYDTAGTSTSEAFEGSSRAVLKMSDYGIKPPSIGPLMQVDDEMVAEMTIRAEISAPPAP